MRDIPREELIAELVRLQPELEKEGVTHMALFGSRARRDNRPDSDIDLVVDLDDARELSLLDIIKLMHLIGDEVGLEANVITRGSLDGRFGAAVNRDEVRVF